MSWKPFSFNLMVYMTPVGILLTRNSQGSTPCIQIINCYAAYSGRHIFWDRVLETCSLDVPSLIVLGDLNLIVDNNEIWGNKVKFDSMNIYFKL